MKIAVAGAGYIINIHARAVQAQKGVELAASMGVVASIVPHTPMKKAVYEDMKPPSVDRMLYLYEAALPIYEKYGLKLYGGTGGIYTSLKGM